MFIRSSTCLVVAGKRCSYSTTCFTKESAIAEFVYLTSSLVYLFMSPDRIFLFLSTTLCLSPGSFRLVYLQFLSLLPVKIPTKVKPEKQFTL